MPCVPPDHRNAWLIDDLLFCVCGSAAACNVPLVIQYLIERKVARRVHVAISEAGQVFVSETLLAVLIGRPCIVNLYDQAKNGVAAHVDVASCCKLAVVAPASANVIAKLANGICDETVTTTLSVFKNPVIIFPAVHPTTFEKPSFQRNLAQLHADGFEICNPVEGYSVSEHARLGRAGSMPGPESVAAYVERFLRFGTHSGASNETAITDAPHPIHCSKEQSLRS
jgi:phosphopantothenoylcysteine decarboxylase/phosphopantothenate--cysteine ligase